MVHKNDQPLKKAVVLLSGGIDSTTTLAIARSAGFIIYALSFRYGQRHLVELEAAKQIALNNTVCQHLIVYIDLRRIGGSALTDDLPVPKNRCVDDMEGCSDHLCSAATRFFFIALAGGGD